VRAVGPALLLAVLGCAEAPTSGSGGGGSGGSDGGGGASGGSAGTGGAGAPPAFDEVPWETGAEIGYGVARKDMANPLGNDVFVGYAGYGLSLEAAEAWVGALWGSDLADMGVRWVFAVQGPADVLYEGAEIGNSHVAAALLGEVDGTSRVIVAAHSSGSYVAHELLGQLAGGLDPDGLTDDRVVYFDLDGGVAGLSKPIVDRLHAAWFVGAVDGSTGTSSPNVDTMLSGGATYAAAGGYWELDASGSGCDAGATWCLHMALVNTIPHDPSGTILAADYEDFAGHPVTRAYLGLVPAAWP